MSVYKNRQPFTIDSKDRITGTDASFTYRLEIFEPEKITHVVLTQASIPRSFYNVQSTFNSFQLYSLDLPGPSNTVTLSLTPANYTRTTLRKVLQTTLNDAANTYGLGYTFAITVDASTIGDRGKYIFTLSSTPANLPEIRFDAGPNLHEIMGFDLSANYPFTTDANGTSLTSVNVTNLQSESTLFIRSNICQNDNDNILQSIYTTQTPGFGAIGYLCPDVLAYSRRFSKANSNIYNFEITDEDGVIIEMNGLNIIFDIILYTYDDTNELLKSFMKSVLLEFGKKDMEKRAAEAQKSEKKNNTS